MRLVRMTGMFCRFLVFSGAVLPIVAKGPTVINPGEVWLDDRGQAIQAHGGSFLQLSKTFFWFGEDRSRTNDPSKRYVACYSSVDLVHWKFRKQVLALSDPEHLGPQFVMERPKIFYNRQAHHFVMYMHLDAPGSDGKYIYAHVAVATSDTVDGEYKYVKSYRPLGKERRDIGQFVDEDGTAYLIFESRAEKGFYIAKLTDDLMNVQREIAFVPVPLEAGAIVHYGGLYYVVGSHLSGWHPNPNVYATAQSLAGPWTEFGDIAPPGVNTYDSQSSALIKVTGKQGESVIYAGDRWNKERLWDSRYIWMPVQIGAGRFVLPQPRPWSIDIHTGIATILDSEAQ